MLHCFIAFLPILFHLSQQNYRLSPRRNVTAATDELPPPQSLLLRFLKRDARKLGTSAKRERSPSHLSSRALLARIEEERLGTRQTDEDVNDSHTGWQKQWITLCTKKHFISQRRETVLFPLSNMSLPSQRHVINTLDDTDFGGKVDFCGGRKTFGVRWTNRSPRTSPRCSGYCANLWINE